MKVMEIDTDTPFQKKRIRRSKYPLETMAVGDSFIVETPTVRSYLSKFSRYDEQGRKFATRRVEDGYRVWRLS